MPIVAAGRRGLRLVLHGGGARFAWAEGPIIWGGVGVALCDVSVCVCVCVCVHMLGLPGLRML